jgi:hypothetical protein
VSGHPPPLRVPLLSLRAEVAGVSFGLLLAPEVGVTRGLLDGEAAQGEGGGADVVGRPADHVHRSSTGPTSTRQR